MSKPKTRRVAAIDGSGQFIMVEEDVPELKPGQVLVANEATVISPGTELGGVPERRANPRPDARVRRFGYSSAGVVLEVGEGCEDIAVGAELRGGRLRTPGRHGDARRPAR